MKINLIKTSSLLRRLRVKQGARPFLRSNVALSAVLSTGVPKAAKLSLCSLAICLAVFSASPAHASKLKLLLTPGSLLSFTNVVDYSFTSGDTISSDADETSANFGLGIVADIGAGPHKFALDYYSQANTFDNTFSQSSRYSFGGLSGTETFETELERTVSFTAFLLGYRYHAASGFYVGGGYMLPNLSISGDATVTYTDREDSGLTYSESASVSASDDFDDERAFALTLGYDWVAPSGLALGVHLMNSLSGSFKFPDGGDNSDFMARSISFGIGYSWN